MLPVMPAGCEDYNWYRWLLCSRLLAGRAPGCKLHSLTCLTFPQLRISTWTCSCWECVSHVKKPWCPALPLTCGANPSSSYPQSPSQQHCLYFWVEFNSFWAKRAKNVLESPFLASLAQCIGWCDGRCSPRWRPSPARAGTRWGWGSGSSASWGAIKWVKKAFFFSPRVGLVLMGDSPSWGELPPHPGLPHRLAGAHPRQAQGGDKNRGALLSVRRHKWVKKAGFLNS